MILSFYEIIVHHPIAIVIGIGAVAIAAFLVNWFAGFLRM